MNAKRSDIILAVALYLLGCFDCAITLVACHRWGVDTWEANPLMAALIRAGDIYFVLFKLGGGAMATYLFLRWNPSPRINKALLAATVLYVLLAGWNILNYYALSTVRL